MIVGRAAAPGTPSSSLTARARPKSRIFTAPSAATFTLAGFKSRWTMPASCAASMASTSCRAMATVVSTGRAPPATRSASGSVHQLEDEGDEAGLLVDVEDRADAGMTDGRKRARLPLEPREPDRDRARGARGGS